MSEGKRKTTDPTHNVSPQSGVADLALNRTKRRAKERNQERNHFRPEVQSTPTRPPCRPPPSGATRTAVERLRAAVVTQFSRRWPPPAEQWVGTVSEDSPAPGHIEVSSWILAAARPGLGRWARVSKTRLVQWGRGPRVWGCFMWAYVTVQMGDLTQLRIEAARRASFAPTRFSRLTFLGEVSGEGEGEGEAD